MAEEFFNWDWIMLVQCLTGIYCDKVKFVGKCYCCCWLLFVLFVFFSLFFLNKKKIVWIFVKIYCDKVEVSIFEEYCQRIGKMLEHLRGQSAWNQGDSNQNIPPGPPLQFRQVANNNVEGDFSNFIKYKLLISEWFWA